ncbi:MAG: hypothetical protein KAJ19_20125 [Gammaproteobacteria bacterium]|nr:hypothetical protein [Gammaproteobacteria bacterium]
MSELKATSEKTYTLSGLTYKDMELICIGLDAMDDCELDMVDRKQELVDVIEYILPDVKGIS